MAYNDILEGKASIGIEFGSTRIKAVLIDSDFQVLASGGHTWQDSLVDGVWTYSRDAIIAGLQDSYAKLKADVLARYNVKLTKVAAIGVSAMMHGYLPFDAADNLLVPFRTWRNTITGPAAAELTELFSFNIPQRWSLAHLYQAILNGEEHVKDITFITTLAGYVHYLLTGCKVIGIGDAAGMMPIDSTIGTYDAGMQKKFDALVAPKGYAWKLNDILPAVLKAGEDAGKLTEAGAKLLDPAGDLEAGASMCPPEGDAGTGMVATNAVAVRTGNISAGTSVFAMIVLEKALRKLHTEIDMVTTPDGLPVAMVHCNTCTSDLNAWVSLFSDVLSTFGAKPDADTLYTTLFRSAMESAPDAAGLTAYNYYSGEPITGTDDGVPMFARRADSPITLPAFMRSLLYSAMATLKIGMDILTGDEQVAIESVVGHGGLFKTPGVGQPLMASALNVPVTCMETAGEGGAWGIALLAAFGVQKDAGETLSTFLEKRVFNGMPSTTVKPDAATTEGFNTYLARYNALLDAEKACVRALK